MNVNKKIDEKANVNKVLIVGHSLSRYESVEMLLNLSGVKSAKPSKREKMLPSQITATLLKAHQGCLAEEMGQISVSPVWNELALDLLLGNIDQDSWCWADSEAISLLDYWKEMDKQLAFALVYNSPAEAIVRAAEANKYITASEMNHILGEWTRYNQALLRFYYRNSEISTLAHVKEIEQNSKTYIELQKGIGVPVSTSDVCVPPIKEESSDSIESKEIYNYFAHNIVQEYSEAVSLYQELQAVANLYHDDQFQPVSSIYDVFCSVLTIQNSKEQSAKVQALEEENEFLLTQLHAVQEELERYYLENQQLKVIKPTQQPKRLYGAAERVKQQLSYRLGMRMIESSRSLIGMITMPFSLMAVASEYHKEMKYRGDEKLPPIHTYTDAYEAEKVKKHLSYMLGQSMIETLKKPLGVLLLPWTLMKTVLVFKLQKDKK
ncbi:hypothetical protein [Sulfuricurvum sp.]|uniref:hypothetical protein n=1 Tax=Sulfuricurvum sp. TaxID=2025608 RepID=UPI002E3203D2|nr:hypothetical protein [Sulfuricurvum sp.]HEX5329455.1 hypothetical protein [Sulfuricurvum sp.]